MPYNSLTTDEEAILLHKATEAPFSGSLLKNTREGLYLCKQCNAVLYRSTDKFESHCGWPAFDDEIPGAVTRLPDPDGRRTEIVCTHCQGHLGHLFEGESFTPKNIRHCVNSLSLSFLPGPLDVAYFASGCFWGTEFYFMKAPGVIKSAVGFMGGNILSPTYEQVCTKTTGHIETVQIIFNTQETSYEKLTELFFETHDFTQSDGQGPDIGPQYLSTIFYLDLEQETIAKQKIDFLTEEGFNVATLIRNASTFWQAETAHQQYYQHKGEVPYCHSYTKRF